jgi:hypothetical protein
MIASLTHHPDTPPRLEMAVSAEIARAEFGMLVVRYQLDADLGQINVPPPVRYASRGDNLWTTTCFEAFATSTPNGAYVELNFAPSTAWAAYGFTDYRDGGSDIVIDPPQIDVDAIPGGLELTAAIDAGAIAALDADRFWQIALSAVIEETDGTKSYWALKHPPGPPDFHHPDCFALTLPAPE